MGKPARTVVAAILIALPCRAWAHGAEELGHHWEVPAYRAEMLTQVLMMAGVSALMVAGMLIRNAWRRRRERQ
jgi:hypothetical protein